MHYFRNVLKNDEVEPFLVIPINVMESQQNFVVSEVTAGGGLVVISILVTSFSVCPW